MLKPIDFFDGAVFFLDGKTFEFDEHELFTFFSHRDYAEFSPVPLTKENLKKHLRFEITHLADHLQAQIGDFVILQPKLDSCVGTMPFILAINCSFAGVVKVEFVHELQQLYYALKKHPLIWIS